MKINAVNSVSLINMSTPCKTKTDKVSFLLPKENLVVPTIENIRACYLPSFKAHQPFKEVTVYNKETNQPCNATILRDDIADFTSFVLYVDNEPNTAGYMHFKNDTNSCEIRHLRTLDAGKKYSGIGTALLGCAIDESFLCKKRGCVWVMSQKGYAKSLSEYNSDENPLPFYLKRGFVSLDANFQSELNSLVEQGKKEEYPDKVLLVLTPDSAVEFRKKYDKDSVYLGD